MKNRDILQEYRCYESGKLLCKAAGYGELEIVSPTNIINYVGPSRKNQFEGLRGQLFAQGVVDLRCSECGRLQARARGIDMDVEIKCRHCKKTTLYNMYNYHKDVLATMARNQRILYYDRLGYGAPIK